MRFLFIGDFYAKNLFIYFNRRDCYRDLLERGRDYARKVQIGKRIIRKAENSNSYRNQKGTR